MGVGTGGKRGQEYCKGFYLPSCCDEPTFQVANKDRVGFKLFKFYYLGDAQHVQLGDQEITATQP